MSNVSTVTVLNLKGRDFVRFGKSIENPADVGHHAIVTPGKRVVLLGEHRIGSRYVLDKTTGKRVPNAAPIVYRQVFGIGDTAEYHSYNLSYMGTIVAITAKTVTIEDRSGKNHRLEMANFSHRNRNGIEEKLESNANWSD